MRSSERAAGDSQSEHVRKPRGGSAERAGWKRERVDRLRTIERRPGVWHGGGLVRTALEVEMWVETVTEGGQRFIATWRKDGVDAARHRQENIEWQRDRKS